MSTMVTARSGSREAHRLIRSGHLPVAVLDKDMYFLVDETVIREHGDRLAKPTPVQHGRAVQTKSVPPFVLLRHYERRYRRLARWSLIGTGAAIVLWIILVGNRQWVPCSRGHECEQLPFGWSDAASLVTIALIGVTLTLYALAGNKHRQANVLEAAEAHAQSNKEGNKIPGWNPPA